MLKSIASSLEEVPEPVREFYKQREDGRFELQTDGAEALKRARDSEKESRRAAEERAKQLFEERERLSNDLEAFKLKEKQLSEAVSKAEQGACDFVLNQQLEGLAKKISIPGSEFLILPHMRERVRAEFVGGVPRIKVLDVQGQDSEASLDDLAGEFRADTRFAAIIHGSRAGGGGATPSPKGGFNRGPKKMTSEERLALKQQDPALFRQLFGLS